MNACDLSLRLFRRSAALAGLALGLASGGLAAELSTAPGRSPAAGIVAGDQPETRDRLPLADTTSIVSLGDHPVGLQSRYAKLADIAPDQSRKPATNPPAKNLILPGESFRLGGRAAFILWPAPDQRRQPQPWICYAPTLPGLPDVHEKWMHEQFLAAGIAVAGIDVGEGYGSPRGNVGLDALYEELTSRRGFARQPCLLGRSRGGLWLASWAAEHTNRVAGIAGIYPVFDLRSYPGLAAAAPAYGLTTAELTARLDEFNPIARVDRLARARIPVFLIHGDKDTVVPLPENSGAFAARYRAAGAGDRLQLNVPAGQGHNMWSGFFQSRELVDFAIARARAGAEPARGN